MYVAESCAKVTLPDLLQFITGANEIPPLGFHKAITIRFYDMTCQRHYPSVSTCDLAIQLPRGFQCPDTFAGLLEEVVLGAHGFGKCWWVFMYTICAIKPYNVNNTFSLTTTKSVTTVDTLDKSKISTIYNQSRMDKTTIKYHYYNQHHCQPSCCVNDSILIQINSSSWCQRTDSFRPYYIIRNGQWRLLLCHYSDMWAYETYATY